MSKFFAKLPNFHSVFPLFELLEFKGRTELGHRVVMEDELDNVLSGRDFAFVLRSSREVGHSNSSERVAFLEHPMRRDCAFG